jgi:DNA-binding XRE family transcriptional regulator
MQENVMPLGRFLPRVGGDPPRSINIKAVLGCNVKAARRRAGLTQRELAARAGVAPILLARIESGTYDPDLAVLGALAEAVGCPAFELVKPL